MEIVQIVKKQKTDMVIVPQASVHRITDEEMLDEFIKVQNVMDKLSLMHNPRQATALVQRMYKTETKTGFINDPFHLCTSEDTDDTCACTMKMLHVTLMEKAAKMHEVPETHACIQGICLHVNCTYSCALGPNCPHSVSYPRTYNLQHVYVCERYANIHLCGPYCNQKTIIGINSGQHVCPLTGTTLGADLEHQYANMQAKIVGMSIDAKDDYMIEDDDEDDYNNPELIKEAAPAPVNPKFAGKKRLMLTGPIDEQPDVAEQKNIQLQADFAGEEARIKAMAYILLYSEERQEFELIRYLAKYRLLITSMEKTIKRNNTNLKNKYKARMPNNNHDCTFISTGSIPFLQVETTMLDNMNFPKYFTIFPPCQKVRDLMNKELYNISVQEGLTPPCTATFTNDKKSCYHCNINLEKDRIHDLVRLYLLQDEDGKVDPERQLVTHKNDLEAWERTLNFYTTMIARSVVIVYRNLKKFHEIIRPGKKLHPFNIMDVPIMYMLGEGYFKQVPIARQAKNGIGIVPTKDCRNIWVIPKIGIAKYLPEARTRFSDYSTKGKGSDAKVEGLDDIVIGADCEIYKMKSRRHSTPYRELVNQQTDIKMMFNEIANIGRLFEVEIDMKEICK